MNRQQHLEWCKKRAHEYVARGDMAQAITSMLSDLSKHEETVGASHGIFAQLGMMAVMSGDRREVERFIDGFN